MMASSRHPLQQRDRRGWRNFLGSLIAVAIVLLGVVGATLTDEPNLGRLGALVGFVVLLSWGYWRQRR
jgi:quinol-cytochrome oxidoreductase complex cytochrome b subunit